MFTDVYLIENDLSSVSELWKKICKEEDLLFFQRNPSFPSRLCEEALKEALSVVYFQGNEGDSWEKREEFQWTKRYQVPVFSFQFTPVSKEESEDAFTETNVQMEKEGQIFCYSYKNNQSLALALQDLAGKVRELALLKYTHFLEGSSVSFSFQETNLASNGFQSPQGTYQGQLFLEKQPMGWGVFSLTLENQDKLFCCGIWSQQDNGDFFALQGKLFQNELDWDHLLYQGDFFLTRQGTLLFMDGKGSCYENGQLIYKGGIYGNSLTDYCLYGAHFSPEETFSGYYSTHGTRIYGSIQKNGEEIYHGTFHNKGKEGYGKEQLGAGKRYTGPYVENDFCGEGSIEYKGTEGALIVSGTLPKDKESFTKITQILGHDGHTLLSSPAPLPFPISGHVKLEYSSRMTYVGVVDGCRKTEGLFRKGNQQWSMTPNTSYDQFEEGFLFHLLRQLDEEEEWWSLAFAERPLECLVAYHLNLCAHLQELHRAFSKKSVDFPDLKDYPYENPDPFAHLEAYLKCKPSQRIHLCVYALEAIAEMLQELSQDKLPFPMVIAWDSSPQKEG